MAYYCLINHDRKFIACVDPKCGCTTVKDWFNQTLVEPSSDPNRNFAPDMIDAESVAEYGSYLTIFFIRDPLRRLVSFYYNWVVQDQELWCFADEDRRVGLEGRTFSEFVHILHELEGRGIQLQHHLAPQTRVLEELRLDEVVKLEHLDDRMVAINERLGVTYVPRRLNARQYAAAPRPKAFDLRPSQLATNIAFPHESFFDHELRRTARSIYGADVRFYESH